MSAESNRLLGEATRKRIREHLASGPVLSQTQTAKDLGISRNTYIKHLEIIKLEDLLAKERK